QSDTAFKTTLLAEPRSNALILRAANPARAAQVRSLVERLDQPPTPGSGAAQGNIHVVYLRNAEATKLATTLRAALAAMGGSGGSASSPAASGPALATPPTTGLSGNSSANNMAASSADSNQPSTGGQIQADPSTNSLVITAPEPVYRQLRAVIDKLDGRRAQVLVESLIVEVSTNKLAQFGIQWQSLLGQKGSTIGLIGTNSGQAG
ncbi:secretin N-terminal domain-containing protein, partial [Verminephrobacter aporrectodeae]